LHDISNYSGSRDELNCLSKSIFSECISAEDAKKAQQMDSE
jgi:hypothetical protein